jgi:hypothetical protein
MPPPTLFFLTSLLPLLLSTLVTSPQQHNNVSHGATFRPYIILKCSSGKLLLEPGQAFLSLSKYKEMPAEVAQVCPEGLWEKKEKEV